MRQLLGIKKADCTGQNTFSVHLAELQQTERLVNVLCAQNACLSVRDLAIDGNDLCTMGFSGPAVGQTLRGLLAAVLDGAVDNQSDALRAWAARQKEDNRHE